jgi:hypothetical protein
MRQTERHLIDLIRLTMEPLSTFQRADEPPRGPVDAAGGRDFRRLITKSSTHHSNPPRSMSGTGSQ